MSNIVYKRNNLLSVDEKIALIQRILARELSWTGTNYIYGLIEKDNIEGKVKPLIYLQTELKYIDPFFNDKISSSIAFYETSRKFEKVPESVVKLICTQLITEVYSESERNISKSINEVQVILKKFGLIREFGNIETGLDAFSDFDKKYIAHKDIHPWAVYSIEFIINYKKY